MAKFQQLEGIRPGPSAFLVTLLPSRWPIFVEDERQILSTLIRQAINL